MKAVKKVIQTLVFTLLVAAPIFSVVIPQPAMAINCEQRILGIPPWFRGMTTTQKSTITGKDECVIESPSQVSGGIQGFILKIALNVVEIGLFIAGYASLFFILYGGFQFLTGGSNPSTVEKARVTLLNAIIGLAIALGSIAVVNLIFGVL
jgi:hypothetical protein